MFASKKKFMQEAPSTFELGQPVLSEAAYERLTIAYTSLYGMSKYFPVHRTSQSLREEKIL